MVGPPVDPRLLLGECAVSQILGVVVAYKELYPSLFAPYDRWRGAVCGPSLIDMAGPWITCNPVGTLANPSGETHARDPESPPAIRSGAAAGAAY
jgi:hypothetical protein